MSAARSARTASSSRAGRLFLLFGIGADRYALEAREVAEVLPLRRLKLIPQAPAWVAGLCSHRGQLIPVLDLVMLLAGQAATPRTSTRLVLVHYQVDAGQSHLLGLILEQASETLRCPADEFRDYGLDNQASPYLGPVYQSPQGLVQWVRVQDLLPAAVRALLFPPAGLSEAPA